MPPAPDALHRYQQDMLGHMRRFLIRLREIEAKAIKVLVEQSAEVEQLGARGFKLVEYAYDEDDGELLNPDAEDIVDVINNGILPDLDEMRQAILEPIQQFVEDMAKRIAALADVDAPRDGMTLVLTEERQERRRANAG